MAVFNQGTPRPYLAPERLATWAARCYEPLLGRLLADLRGKAADCCARDFVGGRVLDVCCGPGGLRLYLQQRGLAVAGVDLDRHMLGAAVRREQAHAQPVPMQPTPPHSMATEPTTPTPTLWALADARQLPFADGSFDAAVVCLALHAMPWDAATAVLGEMRRVARRVVVADYCLPERNLALLGCGVAFAVERLVGGEHYRCYREFQRRGGVEGFLYEQQITVARREHALGGAAMIALCQS